MSEAPLLDRVPEDVLFICNRLREANQRGWIVGGCVRDLLRGKAPKDWDVATDARPEEVKRIFRRVIDTGIAHGTVTVLIEDRAYELTTLRGEGAYSDGRRPDRVELITDITQDLARRDFTMNAIALDPVTEQVIDPFDGRLDLAARILRAVGDPGERFAEDGLRILRGTRFAATLECTIEPATLRAMGEARSLATFRKVSAERVRDEWIKTMPAKRPSIAFSHMQTLGILDIVCPELIESVGCEQNRYHAFDVWRHTLECLDAVGPDPILRMGALLHDVAKPRTRARSDKTQDYTFYEHERIGAEMASGILERLRFSNEEQARIVGLVRHHLICYSDDWSDAAVRRWLRRVGQSLARDLYELGKADAIAKGRPVDEEIRAIDALARRVEAELEAGAALSTKDLAVRGGDLIKELSLAPGPIIGRTLDRLLEVVTDEPSANTKERLLEEARAFVEASRE